MKKYLVLALLALTQFSISAMAANALTYQLLSDSTITAVGGPGSSEALAGSFTWLPVFPSQLVDSDEFFTTSLDFTSNSYSMTLASNPRNWMNGTKTGPSGATIFYADVDLLNSNLNPWTIAAFGSGSYVGSPSAPTEIIFDSEGIAPGGGGVFIAKLYIHAALVPSNVPEEGATICLLGVAMAGLIALRRKFDQR